MKTRCMMLATALAGAVLAAVPTPWTVRIGPRATTYQVERYHGDELDLRATLMADGEPLAYQGEARLYAQTNGMGETWFDLGPASVASNVLTATWLPRYDSGADVTDVFLGAPGNFQAHARIRFLPSPGVVPNEIPFPVKVLDFATIEIKNVEALTNGWSFGAVADLTDATNYTDAVVSAFARTNQVLMAGPYLSSTGGIVSGTVTVEGKALIDEISPGHVTIGRDGVSLRIGTYPFTTTARASWPVGNGTIALDRDIIRATNALAAVVDGKVSATNESGTAYIGWDGDIFHFSYGIQVDASPVMLPASLNGVYFGEQSLLDILDERSIATTNYTDAATNGVLIAARSYTDDSISTNNQAFVSAVLAAPLVGASASDISEIGEYGTYGTVGAALLALIAGLAALKRRMGAAETSLAGKADSADLRYSLVTTTMVVGAPTLPASAFPIAFVYDGDLTFGGITPSMVEYMEDGATGHWFIGMVDGPVFAEYYSNGMFIAAGTNVTNLTFNGSEIPPTFGFSQTATLQDRAVNAVSVSSATTLTLPPAVPGYMRDLIVRLDLTALATAPEVTFAVPTGETVTFEAEDGAMPELEAGKINLVSFTETAAGVIDVAHKVMQEVA